jgi:REP-associated tyrosine transposase
MKEYQSLSHTKWDCKYHVVFIPKRREKQIFGALRRHLGQIFHEVAGHSDSKVVEGHLMSDHAHMCLSMAPKYAVANVVGHIKGKSAIQIARRFSGRQRNFIRENFMASVSLARRLRKYTNYGIQRYKFHQKSPKSKRTSATIS